MTSWKLRAACPDNDVVISSLIRLFSDAYGTSFPVSGVYDPRFWRSNMGQRFTSVMAYKDRELVAHIAVYPDRYDRTLVHLCFPACDPSELEAIHEIKPEFEELLQRLGARQGWRRISFASFGDARPLQQVAESILGTSTVAVLPGYLEHPVFRSMRNRSRRPVDEFDFRDERPQAFREISDRPRSHLILSQKLIQPGVSPEIFAPKRHRIWIEKVYRDLGETNLGARDASSTGVIAADARAIERQYFPTTQVAHLFVQPSLATARDVFARLERSGAHTRQFVFVSLWDSKCPALCEALEEQGLQVCGILPGYRGRDYILLYVPRSSEGIEYDLDRSQFSARGTQQLVGEIQQAQRGAGRSAGRQATSERM